MPNAALNAYLAKNYLNGAKADAMLARSGGGEIEKKKRKKKRVEGIASGSEGSRSRGLRLVDEGYERWKEERNSDEEAVVVLDEEAEQSKRRNKWNKLGGNDAPMETEEAADEKPQMAGEDGLGLDHSMQDQVQRQLEQQNDEDRQAKAEKKSTIRAGLKTKEEMRAERLERERLAALKPSGKTPVEEESEEKERRKRERDEKAQETVYRDASGRKIDVQKDDEERKRVKEEERRREREKKDWNKGQVQLEQVRQARKREEEEKHTSFARYSTDQRMNQQLKEVQRTSDPALGFLTKSKDSKGPQKPIYKGSFPPNRFKIRPGYRWDGVERSNGFESKFFQKKHERGQRQEEMDAWGKEDM